MGRGAFCESNTDFLMGLPGHNADGESLYWEMISKLNCELKKALPKGPKGHPDIHYVPMKGMSTTMLHYLKPQDGKHLNFEGNRRFMKNLKYTIWRNLMKGCLMSLERFKV